MASYDISGRLCVGLGHEYAWLQLHEDESTMGNPKPRDLPTTKNRNPKRFRAVLPGMERRKRKGN